VDNLEQRIDGLEQRVDNLEQRIDGLEQRVDNLEQRIDGLEEKFNGLEETLDLQWESIKFLLASPPNQEINLGCYMRDGTGYNSRRVKWIPHPLFHN